MLPGKSNLWIIFIFCTLKYGLYAYSIDIGIVLDMESWTGKSIHSSIMMALSDFYAYNDGYKRRIVIHTRDSKGDPLQAMSNVIDLLNTVKMSAIIGPEKSIGSKQLALVADKGKVPIFTFASKSSMEHPYLFQIKEDEFDMAKSVTALVELCKWRDVIFVYEDNDYVPHILQYLFESFQDKNIRITYTSAISASATNDQIVEELCKLMKFPTSVIVVHMSPSVASSLFVNAKMLGMMTEEYAWILTPKTIEILHSKDFKVIESLQGTLGFRSYIPMSRRLHDLTKRWQNHFSEEVPTFAVWAYDTVWLLAESVERAGSPQNGSMLLNEILKTEFKGISGEFQLSGRKLVSKGFEIINVFDYEKRKVGYWTFSKGIRRARLPFNDTVLSNRLEDVVWPGGSTTIPKGWILRTSRGKTIKIGVPIGIDFKYFVDADYDAKKNVTTATGFSVDVFNTCIQALPYEVPYEFIPLADGSYDNLIEKIYIDQELDGILADTTILANRSKYVDFTVSYTDVGMGTLTRIKEKDLWILLKPLDKNVWLTFAAFGILTGFTIWAIEAMDQESHGIGSIFWLVLLTIFFAQREKKWFGNEVSSSSQDFTRTTKTLNLGRFGGLFYFIVISMALALTTSTIYFVRAKLEIGSIISFLAGQNLIATIRQWRI